MSGAIPPLPNTPSWRGARLKEGKEAVYGGDWSALRPGKEPLIPIGWDDG
jgi:hypothetical protein